MILLLGIPSEPPLLMMRCAFASLQAPHLVFNQRSFADAEVWFEVSSLGIDGALRYEGRTYSLGDFTGVFNRMMDDRLLPELEEEPADSPVRLHCRRIHDLLLQWAEITPVRVVNRADPMSSNNSKPYQTQQIRRHGFEIPETLITNDPDRVRAFCERHGEVVYKSISGQRSIVRRLDERDLDRLEHIRWCPVQFQEYVDGQDIRVHVVGEEVFATRVKTNATDYRYASREGNPPAELQAMELPADVSARCVALSGDLELPLSGIDLRITLSGSVFCFEVNPSPAFSYYETHTGQPIANAIARYLVGEYYRRQA